MWGDKPLRRRVKAGNGFYGKRESGEGESKGSSDPDGGRKLWRGKPKSVGSWKRLPRRLGKEFHRWRG